MSQGDLKKLSHLWVETRQPGPSYTTDNRIPRMKKLATGLYAAIVVALMVWGFYQAIYVAPDDAMQGYVFRIIYYHVPSASVAFLFFAVSLLGSIGFLVWRGSRPEWAQVAD